MSLCVEYFCSCFFLFYFEEDKVYEVIGHCYSLAKLQVTLMGTP